MYYLSKLQEFENFLATTSKFPALSLSTPSSNHQSSQQAPWTDLNPSQTSVPEKTVATKLVVVEDLPLASNHENQSKLQAALKRLAAAAHFPTVVIISDSVQQENGKQSQGWSHVANCLESLEEGGAKKVTTHTHTNVCLKMQLQQIAVFGIHTLLKHF